MPTVAFNICCPTDCVSRHNGGTAGAPLNPSETIVLWLPSFNDDKAHSVGSVVIILLRPYCPISNWTHPCTIAEHQSNSSLIKKKRILKVEQWTSSYREERILTGGHYEGINTVWCSSCFFLYWKERESLNIKKTNWSIRLYLYSSWFYMLKRKKKFYYKKATGESNYIYTPVVFFILKRKKKLWYKLANASIDKLS